MNKTTTSIALMALALVTVSACSSSSSTGADATPAVATDNAATWNWGGVPPNRGSDMVSTGMCDKSIAQTVGGSLSNIISEQMDESVCVGVTFPQGGTGEAPVCTHGHLTPSQAQQWSGVADPGQTVWYVLDPGDGKGGDTRVQCTIAVSTPEVAESTDETRLQAREDGFGSDFAKKITSQGAGTIAVNYDKFSAPTTVSTEGSTNASQGNGSLGIAVGSANYVFAAACVDSTNCYPAALQNYSGAIEEWDNNSELFKSVTGTGNDDVIFALSEIFAEAAAGE